jgi:hypothetical protein
MRIPPGHAIEGATPGDNPVVRGIAEFQHGREIVGIM